LFFKINLYIHPGNDNISSSLSSANDYCYLNYLISQANDYHGGSNYHSTIPSPNNHGAGNHWKWILSSTNLSR
jgi:hypothetical protein